MQSSLLFTVASLAGALTHLTIFIRGEWERCTPSVAGIYVVSEAILTTACLCASDRETAISKIIVVNIGYLTGLFGSISIYRLFLHPLRDIPGPLPAKLSGFWSLAATLPDFKIYKKIAALHREHGDFVRIRPRELSINHVDAIQDIHGFSTQCSKGPFYDILIGRSLQTTRDRLFHAQRRRVWDRGFTATALEQYEWRILYHCLELINQLSTHTDQPIEITKWCRFFGFDVMGDLVFGKSFQVLQTGKPFSALVQFERMLTPCALLGCVPWLLILLQSLPVINSVRMKWVAWCASQVEQRRKVMIKDVDRIYDSELAVIAGSDTTSFTIAAMVYFLAKNINTQKLLQEEVDRTIPSSVKNLSHKTLMQDAPFLNACIKETLRLYPAVHSGPQRLVPAGGAIIANRWIPGDTLVSTPTYSLHRDSRYFVQPDKFLPERWTSRPDLIRRKEAFNPFLVGAYSCAGRNLAIMEIRMFIAVLVSSFTFRLVSNNSDETLDIFEDSPGVKDKITAEAPEFKVIMSLRHEHR